MIRSAPIHRDVGPVPVALFCAAAAVALVLGGARRARPAAGIAAVEAHVPERALDPPAAPRADAIPARASVTVPPEVQEEPGSARNAPAAPGSERAYLDAFRARERERPGALVASAEAVLMGSGPAPEKVALLRALEELHPDEAALWLARCVRSLPDESGPHADSVPSFALQALARRGASDTGARDALGRLAFDEPSLALPLRRRAAAAFAGVCRDDSLERLRVRLAREPDELLVAGALAALAPRSDEPGVQRVLDAFPPAETQGE